MIVDKAVPLLLPPLTRAESESDKFSMDSFVSLRLLIFTLPFGDGTAASTDANPSHVYQKEGEFTATLTVNDSKGLSGSEEYDILVEKEEE